MGLVETKVNLILMIFDIKPIPTSPVILSKRASELKSKEKRRNPENKIAQGCDVFESRGLTLKVSFSADRQTIEWGWLENATTTVSFPEMA